MRSRVHKMRHCPRKTASVQETHQLHREQEVKFEIQVDFGRIRSDVENEEFRPSVQDGDERRGESQN